MISERHKRRQREQDKAKAATTTPEGKGARDIRLAGRMPYSNKARSRHIAQANAFVAYHSGRLGISEPELLAAICRGWDALDIAKLPATEAHCLERSPVVAKLAAAPILPVVSDADDRERRRERHIAGTLKRKAA